MADMVSSIVYVLKQEDATLRGMVTNDPRDSGGRTRYGIAERFHPELTKAGYFDSRVSAEDALKLAVATYSKEYVGPLMLAFIRSQPVANALLSFAVNEWVVTSIEIAQKALGVTADGIFGPETLEAVNNSEDFLSKLEAAQIEHYKAIVAARPVDACFLKGWLNRVKQDCEVSL